MIRHLRFLQLFGAVLLVAAHPPVPGAAVGHGAGGGPQDGTITVLSFNIHAGKDAGGVDNLQRVAEVILSAGTDLVFLQEVDRGTERSGGVDQLRVLEEATGLQGAFGKTLDYQGGEYGIALLSRWPIRGHGLLPLPVEPPQERAGGSHEPRGVLHAVVDSPAGELHLLNTHLDPSADDHYRRQEMERLLAVADSLAALGKRVLMGGDLNALPSAPVMEAPRARGWRDAWEACGEGEGLTYPAGEPVRRIDYLLLPRGVECLEARVLPTTASDHRPLAVRLGVGGPAPQAVPGTDIWLLPLEPRGAAARTGAAVRVTARPGYDNQPSFLPGGDALLYTVIDGRGQADIWRHDVDSRQQRPVTRTAPESEYSATVMPGGHRISVIRVEADSTQRLWSFDLAGEDPRVLLPDIQPVGYHAWLDADRLVLFVLGNPATLHLASLAGGASRVVAEDIGRSLHRIPGTTKASFLQRREGGEAWITEFDPGEGALRPLAPLPGRGEDYAWTPDGVLLRGQGSRLLRWTPGVSEAWEEVADLSAAGIRGITRLVVSPDGHWLALVGEEGAAP